MSPGCPSRTAIPVADSLLCTEFREASAAKAPSSGASPLQSPVPAHDQEDDGSVSVRNADSLSPKGEMSILTVEQSAKNQTKSCDAAVRDRPHFVHLTEYCLLFFLYVVSCVVHWPSLAGAVFSTFRVLFPIAQQQKIRVHDVDPNKGRSTLRVRYGGARSPEELTQTSQQQRQFLGASAIALHLNFDETVPSVSWNGNRCEGQVGTGVGCQKKPCFRDLGANGRSRGRFHGLQKKESCRTVSISAPHTRCQCWK